MRPKLKTLAAPKTAMNSSPRRPPTKLEQANAFHQNGQLERADTLYREILRTQPQHFDALHLSGVIAAQMRNPERAVELIDKAIRVDPGNAAAYCNRGTALQSLKRWDAALESYNRAIAINNDHAIAYCNRGHVLGTLRKREAAIASYDRALALKAGYAEAHFGRANMLKELEQFDAAIASYDEATRHNPSLAEAHSNRGFVLRELGRLDAAVASYDRALAIRPDFAEARLNRATALLSLGDFERGWVEYEWRWKNGYGQGTKELRSFRQPLWLGQESVASKTILLHAEQGLGDTLQFCRYASLVAELGATVILEAQRPLASLLSGLAGVSQVVTPGSPLPHFDLHCPLLSLPLALRTTLGTIPATVRYLRAEGSKVREWRARLPAATGPRVGLVWAGNSRQVNDHNRSIALADLTRHLPGGIQYVSLQKESRPADAGLLEAHRIWNPTDDIEDFSDTAALCECLDLLISVDTSVAHLGGALGWRTWVLLPFNPDWRWLQRSDSPWYPGMQLYRQERRKDWGGVLTHVATNLSAMVA
jgi:Tfp pilus assembly protein PilF